jgi:hypothetical protein
MNRFLAGTAIALFAVAAGVLAYRTAQNGHSAPILVTGIQEPDEMRVEPIEVETPRPPSGC